MRPQESKHCSGLLQSPKRKEVRQNQQRRLSRWSEKQEHAVAPKAWSNLFEEGLCLFSAVEKSGKMTSDRLLDLATWKELVTLIIDQ